MDDTNMDFFIHPLWQLEHRLQIEATLSTSPGFSIRSLHFMQCHLASRGAYYLCKRIILSGPTICIWRERGMPRHRRGSKEPFSRETGSAKGRSKGVANSMLG